MAAPAQAAAYAPAGTADIHPGTMMYTDGAQCTANFVYTDASGATYVGYAAHCAGQGAATDTDGCSTRSLPLGTEVTFNEGGSLVDEGTRGRHRHPGLQQLADHAETTVRRTRTPAPTTTWRWSRSAPATSAR